MPTTNVEPAAKPMIPSTGNDPCSAESDFVVRKQYIKIKQFPVKRS